MHLKKLSLATCVAMVAVGAALASACGGDSGGHDDATIAAITFLDAQPFHEFEVELTEKGTAPVTAETVTRKAQAVLELTDWPSSLKSQAKKLAGLMDTFADELEKDPQNIDAIKAASTNAHNAWHDFSHAVWDVLQDDAGVSSKGGDSHSHD